MNSRRLRPALSLGELLSQYNGYGRYLRSETRMSDVAENLYDLVEFAERTIVDEGDDWYDRHTVSRNVKELRTYIREFQKIASEADAIQSRATALYDDIGHVLTRYFENRELNQPDAPILPTNGGYDTDDDGTPDVTPGNIHKDPVKSHGSHHMVHEADPTVSSDMSRLQNLRERILRLARVKLTGEQLKVFDTLNPALQLKAAWKIIR